MQKDIIPALGNLHHLPAGQPCLGVHTVNVTLGHMERIQSEHKKCQDYQFVVLFGYFTPVCKLDSNQCLSGSLHISRVRQCEVADNVLDLYPHVIIANPCHLPNLWVVDNYFISYPNVILQKNTRDHGYQKPNSLTYHTTKFLGVGGYILVT